LMLFKDKYGHEAYQKVVSMFYKLYHMLFWFVLQCKDTNFIISYIWVTYKLWNMDIFLIRCVPESDMCRTLDTYDSVKLCHLMCQCWCRVWCLCFIAYKCWYNHINENYNYDALMCDTYTVQGFKLLLMSCCLGYDS
jgi:hypothetical protein